MEITINHLLCRSREGVLTVASPAIADFLDEWASPDDFVWGHTSGSTGEPKPVKLLKRDMEASAQLTNAFFGITNRSTMLLCLSPDYIAGKMMIVRAMLAGADLLVVPPSSRPMSNIFDEIDFAAMVPAQVVESLKYPEDRERLGRIGHLIVGGAPLSTQTVAELNTLQVAAYATYGMTETVSHVALCRLGDSNRLYRAMEGITFSMDSRDCLVIRTPHFSTQEFVTNDVVELVGNQFFRWIGRFDHVINTGGVKVFPETVEQKIAGLFPSRRFFITASSDAKWGECVTLVIEGEPLSQVDETALLDAVRERVTRYEFPRRVLYRLQFCETASGKVKRTL